MNRYALPRVAGLFAVAVAVLLGGTRASAVAETRLLDTMDRGDAILRAADAFALERGRWPSAIHELVPKYLAASEPRLIDVAWIVVPAPEPRVDDMLALRQPSELLDGRDSSATGPMYLAARIYGDRDDGSLRFDWAKRCWVLRPATLCFPRPTRTSS